MGNKNQQFRMQEIHTPSAFEGAIWAALGIKDARTVLHSPPGCYINQHVNAMINDWYIEMYTSNLPYSSIMQGGEDRLETTLHKVAAKEPEAIIVITSPPVEVAQDDIEGVAKKVGYKNTVVIRPPIGGITNEGKEETFLRLLDIMEPSTEKRKKSVNIIGPTFSMFNWMADLFELKRMLKAIGVTVNTVMTAGATVDEIKRAPQAELNLCMYPYDCGVETAKEMEKRFGIPYMDNIVPIGFENTAKWIGQIADFFKIDAMPFLKNAMTNAFEFIRSPMVFAITFEMSAALSFENHSTYAVGIGEFYTNELGVDIVMASLSNEDASKRMKGFCNEVLLSPTIEDKRNKFIETAPMVIFGNFYDKKVTMDEGFTNFIFADMPSIGYLNTENCPFMGFLGAKYLTQALVNEVYMSIFLETKGEMSGSIAVGDIPWEIEAEQALLKISEMIPHFVRTTAVKKLHQVAEEIAKSRNSSITVDIIREVADKYTPTKFKAKFSTVFSDAEENEKPEAEPDKEDDMDEEDVPIDSLKYTMPWDEDARQLLELVPPPFRQVAASGTEDYTKEHSHKKVTVAVFNAYREELGM